MWKSKSTVLIPLDFLSGGDSVRLGYPYIVPEAAFEIEQRLKPNDAVLECGCGGSSIFFARRVKSLLSLETSEEWAERVRQKLQEEKLENVKLLVLKSHKEHVAEIAKIPPKSLDVCLVDSHTEITNRRDLLKHCLPKVKIGGMMVIDNYDAFGTQDSDNFMRNWEIKRFTHPLWSGTGTKTCVRLS